MRHETGTISGKGGENESEKSDEKGRDSEVNKMCDGITGRKDRIGKA